MRATRIGVPLLLVCLMLASGCGAGGPGTEPDPTDPAPTTAVTSPPTTAAPSTSAPTPPSGGVTVSPTPQTPGPPEDLPTGSARPMTLTGTVQPGVEHNCFLLDGYLLVGGPADLVRAGARVRVTGHVQADLMTTCQQGVPFVVQRVEPA
ncbi:hypothetical protein [Solwaraspora sp. WMMA2101]|uniref:hypothetical protein n=1 Tax=Solwaraspora sp. WMMA2101 TaxID=3404124 RepID=UPI00259B26C0|nr:hypothetical protein [Solwaraspora sp. WMMA2056]WJK40567.1 hypothetical protein O7608_29960 [Solwaraspora sp. WMMA2056]